MRSAFALVIVGTALLAACADTGPEQSVMSPGPPGSPSFQVIHPVMPPEQMSQLPDAEQRPYVTH